jgi:O-antigen ligase
MTVMARDRWGVAARRAAWLAFAALVVLSPFRARIELVARPTVPVYGDYTDFLLFWSDLAALVTLGLWLASLVLSPRRVSFRPWFITGPVGVLLVVAWVGVPSAVDVPLAAYTAVRLVILAALGLYVANEVGQVSRVVWPVTLMVAVQGVVGIGQVVRQHSLGLAGLGEYVLAPRLAVSVITSHDGTRLLRAYGLTDHPNILGGVLALALVLIAGAIVLDADRARRWHVGLFTLGGAALLLTFSRGAWLGLVVGLGVMAAMLAGVQDHAAVRRLSFACVAGLIVAAPLIGPYHGALRARTDPSARSATEVRSVDERKALSDATMRITTDRPLLGVGAGALPLAMRAERPAFRYDYQPASVVLLDVTAETGLLGGAAYLVVLAAPWLALVRHRARWTVELAAASGALGALTVLGLFDYYPWTYSAGRIWAWLVLGLWAAAYRHSVAGSLDAA